MWPSWAVLPGSGQNIHDVVGPKEALGRRVALAQIATMSGTGSEAAFARGHGSCHVTNWRCRAGICWPSRDRGP